MTAQPVQNVLIIGGGIAGAALAIALGQRGIRSTIVEKQTTWQPSSSGIFIYANGLAALDRLGVLGEILEAGWASEDGVNPYLDVDGTPIVSTVYPRIGGDHVPPIVGIKRADLHRVLAGAVGRADCTVRLGTTVEAFDEVAEGVRATFSTGEIETFDVAVAADGIRSATRTMLFGPVEPTFTGFGTWRSIHRKPPEIDNKILMMGIGKRLGIMPISKDMLYVFATSNEPGNPWYDREQWHTLMLEKFAEFGGPATALLAEIERPEQVLYTPIEEIRIPLPWSRGRIVLIGDAAHASSPFMGQGGAMAMEDAVVLADELDGANDVPAALEAFVQRRAARCHFVQEESRKVGERGGEEDAAACVRRNAAMKLHAQNAVDTFYVRMKEPI